jgi:RNA polymerase sigma-70 factor (ECF subfamily)
MDEGHEDFAALMQGIREGSEDAAKQLVERYGPHVLRVVRKRLNPKLRSKFDSSDFQQDVWASFFVGVSGRTFERPEALMAFLAKMARNKVLMAVRQRCQIQKYNVDREHSLDGSAACEARDKAGPDPTPSQLVVAQEKLDQLLKDHPPRYQRILILLSQGYTQVQISRELGVSERMVRRVIQKLWSEALS